MKKLKLPPKRVSVSIDNQTILRTLAWVSVFWLTLQFLGIASRAITLIIIAFFLAMAINPLVGFILNKTFIKNRTAASGLALLATISVLVVLIVAIAPITIRQTQSIISSLPEYMQEIKDGDTALSSIVADYDLVQRFEEFQEQAFSNIGVFGGAFFSAVQSFFLSLASMLTVLVLAFFMVAEGPAWLDKFWSLHPKDKLKRRKKLFNDMYRSVTGYVNGQLLIAFISGVITLILASVLGLPYAFALAAIIAVTGLIPLIGNTLGAVVVIAVALFQSFGIALFLTVFYIVYQQIENNIIQPAIQSQTVALSPLAILISALIGISLAGFLGALIAIPVGGSIRVLIIYYLENRELATRA
jgi:predicted PurR-regulated permease PerM